MLAVVLVLAPTLSEAGDVRLVATGVGGEEVAWSVDGVEVARTSDREAVTVHLAAGEREVRAASAASGPWQVVARLDEAHAGAVYVPAWTAQHVPDPPAGDAGGARAAPPLLPTALALAAAVLLAWPRRRGLEARRRARRQ